MSSFDVNVVLDDATLLALAHIKDFESRSFPFLKDAMAYSLDVLKTEAVDWMYAGFKNPTGAMETAWWQQVYGAYEAELENTAAYGQRRNYGFSGMTDALGRYYPYDPGIEWAEDAVQSAIPDVELAFRVAYDRTIAGI